jgi:KDO2-lipid IV(A) lauroyltransferase
MSDPATKAKKPYPFGRRARHYLSNLLIVGIIRTALALPYKTRVGFVGGLVQHILAPLAGYRRRALDNLEHVWPEMPLARREEIATRCLNNLGRSFIENYSAEDFPKRMAKVAPQGPGMAALEEANRTGQPVILVTGHYGNYEAARASLVARGYDIGGLYRKMKNPYFNAHYVKTAGFVRHLKQGGRLVLLFDQHVIRAPILDFIGKPARTAISAAELALRYDALLIPFYGIRQDDGVSFDVVLEAPVPHSDPMTMTQALNDSLTAQVTKTPEQWFWVHRRWRPHET